MAFTETRFPVDISYGSRGGPEFSTDIVVMQSGYEQRNSNWSQARLRYNVAYGVKTKAQLDNLISFFRARKGQAEGFRFKDWTDYEIVNESLGVGDGVQTAFQLAKTYNSGGGTHQRIIQKPVTDTVKVYVDSILQESGYSLDSTKGILTFSTAPAMGGTIVIDAEFDVPVRFATDTLSTLIEDYGSYSVLDIPLIEIRP